MLISEKMRQTQFSPTEQQVVDYILSNKEILQPMTIRKISEKTFSSPAILIKIAKKMDFNGWNDLKRELLKEFDYLSSHFDEIDANVPFNKNDGIMTITNKIATLYRTTIDDSLSLLKHDPLQKALAIIEQSAEIKVFGNNVNTLISQDFALKMNRIKKYTSVCTTDGEQLFEAANCRENSCAIILSYSGETERVLEIIPILKQRKIPIIALTSIGENSLAKEADCVLQITTREKLYSKVGNLSPNVSIHFILDTLYSCIFAENYEKNLKHVIEISKLNDPRTSTVKLMSEKE